ncbi:MAG: formylglycine-generating enzyme family protein [Prevotella sp.]|nr:formylglycine-generating enzyme family protein [Prevotella sp.]
MNRLIQILFATLLLALLPTAEASAQIRRAQPHKKPPTSSTTTTPAKPTKPKPPKKKPAKPATTTTTPARSRDAILSELLSNMVYVEGGTFTMGATREQGSDATNDEKPAHQVTLSSFHICKYEVTQELWQAVMGSNPSGFKGAHRPVENVSWEDCQDFIRRLNDLTGKNYRLPTEAEWEYAARGGNRSYCYKYAGGSSIDDVAWYMNNSNYVTHDVGLKRPNELGLYDMAGNVWEWCLDWYDFYSSDIQTNPRSSSLGTFRMYRGGGWSYDAMYCRVSCRSRNLPTRRYTSLGLRLAL